MKYRLFSCVAVVGILIIAGGCQRPNEAAKAEPEEKRPIVLLEKVKRADLVETLVYPVDLEPETKVSINSLMSERIVKFAFDNGDSIKKGQIVAKVRADNATQALAQMRAELESLDAQIESQKREQARAEGLLDSELVARQHYDNVSSQVKVAEAKRKSVEAAISQTAINAGHAVIRAPISGVIANKRVNQGDLAAPGLPLCDIIVVDPISVVLKVPERELQHVRLDQHVTIALDAYPNRTFDGAVAKILPYLDPNTRTNEVEVRLPNPIEPATKRRWLKPGMFGRATIIAETHVGALVVPERALLMADDAPPGEMVAFVVVDGIARKRTVRIGIRQDDRVAIVKGLNENEQVVVRGQYGLKDGQPVKRFEDDASADKKPKEGAHP